MSWHKVIVFDGLGHLHAEATD